MPCNHGTLYLFYYPILSTNAEITSFYKILELSEQYGMIAQKCMTFDHEFCYSCSFSSFLFFKEGREKRKRITKVVVKIHAFLLDHMEYIFVFFFQNLFWITKSFDFKFILFSIIFLFNQKRIMCFFIPNLLHFKILSFYMINLCIIL